MFSSSSTFFTFTSHVGSKSSNFSPEAKHCAVLVEKLTTTLPALNSSGFSTASASLCILATSLVLNLSRSKSFTMYTGTRKCFIPSSLSTYKLSSPLPMLVLIAVLVFITCYFVVCLFFIQLFNKVNTP